MTQTDGYKIKDAELFEVSVVSVPCNQGATFWTKQNHLIIWKNTKKFISNFYKANSNDSADAVEIEQPSTAKAKKWRQICQKKIILLKATQSLILKSFATEAAEKAVALLCNETSRT
jgi:hypothetical protein